MSTYCVLVHFALEWYSFPMEARNGCVPRLQVDLGEMRGDLSGQVMPASPSVPSLPNTVWSPTLPGEQSTFWVGEWGWSDGTDFCFYPVIRYFP